MRTAKAKSKPCFAEFCLSLVLSHSNSINLEYMSGRLGGAGLDVFEKEPSDPGNPLFKMDNVVVCPHLGGGDAQSIADMGAEAARCAVSLYRGQWPDGAVVNDALKNGWRWSR